MMTQIYSVALLLSVFLVLLQFSAPWIRKFPGVPEYYTTSFTGGFAVSYVFLHLLPGLAENRDTLGQILAEHYVMTPLKDLVVYFVGLLGFLLFFALGRIADQKAKLSPSAGSWRFYLQLIGIALSNGIITYTMPLRVYVGHGFAILFSVAIGLHFVIQDQSLERTDRTKFKYFGRFILILALALGFLLSILNQPNNVFVVALLDAFLAGSILMNVFRNEIPSGEHSSFSWFVTGCVVGSGFLFVLTYLEKGF